MPALYRIVFLFLAFFGAFSAYSQANVTITPAATLGGVPICIGGSPVNLTPIVIAESDTGDPTDDDGIGGIAANWLNITLILSIPADFQFVAGVGTVAATPGSDDVVINSFNITTSNITIDFDALNNTGTDKFDAIIISGLQVRAVSGPAQTLNITRTGGTSTIAGLVNGTVVGSVTSVLPPTPVITGDNSVCANEQNVVYALAVDTGNNYSWIVSGGTIDGSSTGSSVTVDWGASGTGFLRVTETNATTGCATTTANYNVTINANPTPVISGNNSVCANQTGVVYSTPAAAGRTYNWSVTGGAITAGAGTNSITVTWGAAGAGTVELEEIINATTCAVTTPLYNVTINANPAPSIAGPATACANESGAVYTTGATGNNFNWTVNGGTITAGQGTNSITVTWGSAGAGTVRVTETITATGCATTTANYNVTINANPTPVISGNNSVCANQTGVVYSTPAAAGRTYNWTVVGGAITAGAGTNSITVTWGAAGAGTVELEEIINATTCAVTTPLYNVTINANPAPSIVGPATACANETGAVYTTGATGNNFNWTVNGGTITAGQGTNSITVTWGSAGAGTVRVTETITATGCATTTANYNVTINANPTPVISGNNSVCANQTGVVYSTAASGNTFSWTVTGGTIVGPSTGNSIVVDWGAAGVGTVRVQETSATCSTITPFYNVTINANPAPVIGGPATACANETGAVYTTAATGNNFNWTVNGGTITAGQGTNSITVMWGSAGAGTVRVTETITATGCATTTANYNVTINANPTPVISGNNSVCADQTGVVYSTPAAAGRTYNWSVTGGAITAGAGTNSITVTWGAAGAGTVELEEIIDATLCSVTTPLYNVTINANPAPSIVGPATACANESGAVYTTGATGNNFNWTVNGGTITAGQGTNSITVTWGSAGAGTVRVTETITATGCATTTANYNVTINANPTPVISGNNSVCANQTGVVYSTPAAAGRTYNWSVTGGAITAGAGTNSITVTWGAAGAGTVQLQEIIDATTCSVTTPFYNVTINANPAPSIAGPATACANESGAVYTTGATGNNFNWTVNGGTITAGQGSNSITVTWGSAGAGTVRVTETITATGCATTTANYNVTINANPTPVISGNNSVCANQTGVVYSTPAAAGRTYNWSVTGGAITAGAGTNSITVTWGAAGAGTVQLQEIIDATTCSVTTPFYNVTINANPAPVIAGPATACANESGAVYTTAATGNNFNWTVNGGTITAGQGTNSITVMWGSAGAGTVRVTETITATGCATTTANYNVTINANPTPVISGNNSVCADQTGVVYSTPAAAGRTYNWSVTGGAITAGAGTNSITVTWGAAGAGTVQLQEIIDATTCSVTTPFYNVTINANPAPSIVGPATACANETGAVYTTAATGNNFNWTVNGGTITAGQGTNSITVTWGSAGAGTVRVTETITATGCATTTANYNVTINANPTPVISGNNSVCANQTGVVYSTPAAAGRTYNWTVVGGAITAGAGTNSITVTWGAAGAGTVELEEIIDATLCSVTTPLYNVTINANPAPSIVGPATACANESGAVYTTGATGNNFNWTVNGGTITAGQGTNSITVTWGSAGAGTVRVTETITATGCATTTANYNVTINANPTPVISGNNSVCANQTGVVYSTPAAAGRTYNWSVTGGAITAGAGTNSITVTWGAAGAGTVQLQEIIDATTCSVTTPFYNVTINANPAPVIAGPATACANESGAVYTTGATGNNFNWTVNGGTITAGQGSNSITVTWGSAGAGTVRVTETITATGCATTTANYNVTINANPTPVISGNNSVCAGEQNITYSVPFNAGRTYAWTVSGGTIDGPSNGNSIVVDWGAAGPGTVAVLETIIATGCSALTPDFNILINNSPSPVISGLATVCANTTGVVYSTPNVPGDLYSWSVSGGTIVAGAGTNSITVDWGAAGAGSVTVTQFIVSSSCTVTTPPYNVTIEAIPTPSITGDNTVCENAQNKVYTTPLVAGHTYAWSVTGGTIDGSSNGNSIVVDWGAAGTGTIQLTETITASGCFITTPIFNVNINTLPTPVISGLNVVCANDAGVIYSTPNSPGNTYTWSVSGGSIVAGAGTNSITVNWGPAGAGTIEVTEVVPSSSCITTTPVYTVTINPTPAPVISGDNAVCANEQNVVYTSPFTAGNTYSWNVTGGTIDGSSTNNTVTVDWGAAGPGTLTLTETVGGCTTVTPVYNVTINPNPTPVIAGNNNVCRTETGVLYSTPNVGGNTYAWTVVGGTIDSGAGTNEISVTWTSAGTGSVSVVETITATGCNTLAAPLLVTVSPNPIVNAGSDQEICEGSVFNFTAQSTPATASNFASLQWTTTGTGVLTNATTLTPNYTPGVGETGPVTFTLTAEGIGTCADVADQMILNITPLPTVDAGSNSETCAGAIFNFSTQATPASASNYATLTWSHTGTGTLFNPNTIAPTYLPGAGETGTITFTLLVTSTGSCASTSDQMDLVITPAPTVNAGGDAEICQGSSFDFSTQAPLSTATNFASLLWTTTGTGSLTGANTLTPSYTPGIGETGSVTFTLTATGNGSCAAVQDAMVLQITPAPIVNAGSDAEICQGSNFSFASQSTPASASNFASLLWTTSGSGSLFNATTLTPTYIPQPGETGVVTFTLTADGGGSCADVNDQMTLTITPAVIVSAGSDAEICQGLAFNFATQATPASASNFNTITWTTSGTGSLANANTLTPTYTSGVGETGGVIFTLTATGNGSCATLNDQMVLTITPAPLVFAGSDEETCQGVTFNFGAQASPATASQFSSIQWTTTGTGTLVNATTLSPIYTPGVGETGAVTFTLTATGNGSCVSVNDQMILNITPSVIVSAGSDSETCQGVAFAFSTQITPASASNFNTITWTTSGTGSLVNANTLTPTYTPGVGETGNVTFTLTATGNGSCATLNDQMVLTITPAPLVSAGSDAETCQGVTFNFNTQATLASASNFSSILWSHTGSGTIFNANTLTPTYTPGVGETGNVVFTLTATGNGSCALVNDQMTLVITPEPTVFAGSDSETCQGVTFNFSSQTTPASATQFASLLWTHSGTGTLTNANTLTPSYTPGVGETGNVILTLTVNGNGSCASVNDQMTLVITPAPVAFAGSDSETCQGVSFNFNTQTTPASATNASSILWTHSGTGTIFNANTLTPTYQPGVGEAGNVTFTLTVNGNGSCVSVNDQMILVITPAPTVNAGSNQETCEGVAFNFSTQSTPASATNYSSILWTTTGTGSLTNASTFTPTYTPGVGETGAVTFTLTASGNGSCVSVADQMILNITPAPVVSAGSDAETCQGVNFNFSTQSTPASVSNFSSILWTTTGTGLLSNANTLTPTYVPGVGETGFVTFTLTANGNGSCVSVNDQMILTITPAPTVFAGSDAETCQGVTYNFTSQSSPATATNFQSILWTTTGTGTLNNASTLTPSYVPGVGETGNVTFTLTATGNGSCVTIQDQMTLVITPAAVVSAGSDSETCQGVTFNFNTQTTLATASNFNTILWTTTGAGVLSNANTLTPTYVPAVGETGNITFTLTATGNGSCVTVNDQMILSITPAATVFAGSDEETCQGVNFSFASQSSPATATNFLSILWTTTGTGSITNANTLTPTYTPGVGETGNVIFTLTATGNGSCVSVQDQMTLVVTPAPVLSAGSDAETCQGVTFNFTAQGTPASALNYATITWTTTGTGILFNPNTLTPTYQSGVGEAGNVTFTLTATGNGSCATIQDQMVLTITPSAIVSAGSDAETCEGVVYNFSSQVTPATANNFSSIIWTTSGLGSLTNANTLTPTYTPGVGETGNVTFTLTASGNGSCVSVNDMMVLVVTPAVMVNAGSDAEICQGGSLAFSSRAIPASASNFSSLQWTHNGSGTLFDGTTLSPTYFASPGETGIVTFTLTAFANGSCVDVNDVMEITITPGPTANAGSNDAVCEGTPSFDFSTRTTIASASNGSLFWSHNGTGSLNDDTALNPVYTVGVGDVGNVVTFTLTVTSPSAICAIVTSSFELRVNPQALVSVPATLVDVCEPDRINLSGSIGGSATSGTWSLISGDGTLSTSSITGLTVTASYDTELSDVGNVLTFRLTTNDPDGAGPCSVAFIDVDFNVEESAKVFAGADFAICEYDDITLNGSFSGSTSSVTWSGGTNNFDVATNPITGYTLNNAERSASNLSIIFTLTTNDPAGVCPAVSDQVVVAVRDTLNFVTFTGLAPTYQEDDPIDVLNGVPPGGVFTGPGIISGTNQFNPDFANIGVNAIRYTYQDPATGCFSSPIISTIVNPVTTIDWELKLFNPSSGLYDITAPEVAGIQQICATIRSGDVLLQGTPDVLDPSGSTLNPPIFTITPDITPSYIFQKGDGQYYLNTKNLPPGTYIVKYIFTNTFEAQTELSKFIEVLSAPRAVISTSNFCVESTVTLTEASTIPNNNGANISEWRWSFIGNFGTNIEITDQNPMYEFLDDGLKDIRLFVATNEGCRHDTVRTVRVGPIPDMRFSWTEFCSGDSTQFTDETDAGISTIDTYTWVFDDGNSISGPAGGPIPVGTNGGITSGTYGNPKHRYGSFGLYDVQLTVTTNDGCVNSLTRKVFIQDYGTPGPISSYFENFESGQGTWVRTVANNGALTADNIVTDTSWVWGPPNGQMINTGANGSVNAWWTGSNSNNTIDLSTYYNDERSAVIGPCLNLVNIKRPMISIDYWADIESQRDGAVLQYSIDGGANWLAVGDISGAGINWYNQGSLLANPGAQPIGQYGWTSIQGGWKTARFNLDMIPEALRDKVIIRVAFGSGDNNALPSNRVGIPYEGFAFDNVFVGEKQRNVLVEYFTNSGISSTANDYLNNLYELQFTEPEFGGLGRDSADFFKIQYHIANPSPDVINAENPIDPAARSLYYGVSQPPSAIMDGVLGNYFGKAFNGDQTKITAVELDRRALEDPLFAIEVTQNPTTNDSIDLTVDYEYIAQQSVTTPYTFQVALVEGDVNGNVNVLRKMLMGSEGLTVNQTWNNGTVQNVPVKSIVNVPVQNGNNLYLVAFVQDRNTKRIHQSRVIQSEFKVPTTVVGIGDDPVLAQVKDLVIFPNPASNRVNFGIESGFGNVAPIQGYTWSIIDQRGVEVLRGTLNEDLSEPQQVELDRLANGMYIVTFSKGNRVVVQKKLAVMNRH